MASVMVFAKRPPSQAFVIYIRDGLVDVNHRCVSVIWQSSRCRSPDPILNLAGFNSSSGMTFNNCRLQKL